MTLAAVFAIQGHVEPQVAAHAKVLQGLDEPQAAAHAKVEDGIQNDQNIPSQDMDPEKTYRRHHTAAEA